MNWRLIRFEIGMWIINIYVTLICWKIYSLLSALIDLIKTKTKVLRKDDEDEDSDSLFWTI